MRKFFESKKGNLLMAFICLVLLGCCFLLDNHLTVLEWYGTIIALIQAVFIMFDKKENWIFYCTYVIAFTILSIEFKLFGDVLENMVYLILGIIGINSWYRARTPDNKIPTIQYASNKLRVAGLAVIVVVTIVLYSLLKKTDDPTPFLDALTTSIGFVATYLMAKKKVEAWMFWFIADILMCVQYFVIPQQPLGLIILNVVWTGMALGSFITWHRYSIHGVGGQYATPEL